MAADLGAADRQQLRRYYDYIINVVAAQLMARPNKYLVNSFRYLDDF